MSAHLAVAPASIPHETTELEGDVGDSQAPPHRELSAFKDPDISKIVGCRFFFISICSMLQCLWPHSASF